MALFLLRNSYDKLSFVLLALKISDRWQDVRFGDNAEYLGFFQTWTTHEKAKVITSLLRSPILICVLGHWKQEGNSAVSF